ncbi:4-amino-4-deoxychorismate lyase [Shewanella colwelliana]|uniref:aminodeoxychorismate lyase n=1 Tax=Shewanella colwelliana TaxID=23 RepID=UPI001BC282BE|nr:aminodeoxychorismate lyase [Shewanella colwelliana]GIU31107.1 4-amino-4-deoxychorismate lyase [Shewanella colwelliana]
MSDMWINGLRQNLISGSDRGLAYGDGLFATMRCGETGIKFRQLHLERLSQSAQRLGFVWQASPALLLQLDEISSHSFVQFGQDFCIKLLISRGSGGRGYQAPQQPDISEIVSVHAIPAHYSTLQQQGVALQTSPIRLAKQPRLAGMKHLNRLEQVLIKSQTLAAGFDDWLVLDSDEKVIESSMANLFCIKDEQVVTPALSASGVAGVMREQLIYWLNDAGYCVQMRTVDVAELEQFDHLFISNSLFGVISVNQVNQFHFTSSPIVSRAREALSLSL